MKLEVALEAASCRAEELEDEEDEVSARDSVARKNNPATDPIANIKTMASAKAEIPFREANGLNCRAIGYNSNS